MISGKREVTNNMWSRLVTILFFSDLHGLRFILAIAELLWAFTLFMPGDTFGRPTYNIMATVMNENAWAFFFMIMGVTQLSILTTGKYHDRFAVWFAGINASVWWYLVTSFYFSVSPLPAAVSGEVALAIGASWIWIRSGICIGRRACDG